MKLHASVRKYVLITIVLMVGLEIAEGQQSQLAAPALNNIEQRFYEILARAAAGDLEKTKRSGGGGGGKFRELRPEGGLLVGFEAWHGNWNGHTIIRGLRPIFQTATGRIRGERHGDTPGDPHARVEAKEGYAVAAIKPHGGDRLDGFQVLFWKIRASMARLDAEGAYKSDWLGGKGGGRSRHPLSSDGRPVIGIAGASGADIDRLGLIYAEPR